MDEERFDELMTSADPAMAIVTTISGDERSGCLVGFHGQTSIEPRRYGVRISKANHTCGVIVEATHAAVHLLDHSDLDRSRTFGELTGDEVDKFELVDVRVGPGGVPILRGCEHGFAARIVGVTDDGGDHVLVTLDPIEVWSSGPFEPLRLHDVDDMEPGHPAG